MEPEINCSELCDSFSDQELDWRPLHHPCRTTIVSEQSWGVRATQIIYVVAIVIFVLVDLLW